MAFLNKFPPLVYYLFVFLVIAGLRATISRTMSIYRLLIFPIIFTLLNLGWLSERIHEQFSLLVLWLLGLFAGSILGWQSVSSWKIKANRKSKTLTVPGSWSILFLILIIFAIRIFFIYKYETIPNQVEEYYIYDSLLSGLFTGIFIGRAYDFYQKYKKG